MHGHAYRTKRAVVILRTAIAAFVALHVALIWTDLVAAGFRDTAGGAVVAIFVSAGWGALLLRSKRPGPMLAASWAVAAIDAIALVTIARVTIAVDPSATVAWAFVLWVPFSIAIRARALASGIATVAIAALVYGSTVLELGALEPLDPTWTAVGVPVLLVFVGGAVTSFAMMTRRRVDQLVMRELDDERDRALRLREADDLKNTFLSAVSHEIRTPLTSILGFAVTMLDRPELDDQQRDRMLRTVVAEAEHLEDILANLLDLDRLTRGKVSLVPVEADPAVLVRAATEHVRARSGRQVRLDLQEGLRMRLDSAKIERIVENLVGNAVKYTPSDADVEVHVRAEAAGLLIRVDDSGPGIGRDLRETIFEPFRRGVDVGVPGTGIGLSLVDRFSRMHGGRAWVEDRPGGGCRFQVYVAELGAGDTTATPHVESAGGERRSRSTSISSIHGSVHG